MTSHQDQQTADLFATFPDQYPGIAETHWGWGYVEQDEGIHWSEM